MTAGRGSGGQARPRSVYVGPWRIDLVVEPDVADLLPLSRRSLVRSIVAALDAVGAPRPASAGLTLTEDDRLAALNATHLGVSGPTDVLSFPLLPPEAFGRAGEGRPAQEPAFVLPPGARANLGDIVVSVERAIDQAIEGRGGQTGDLRWTPADEMRLLVTHGALHLCGWDHADPADETAMRALERRLLSGGRDG